MLWEQAELIEQYGEETVMNLLKAQSTDSVAGGGQGSYKELKRQTIMILPKQIAQFIIDNLTCQHTCKCLSGLSRY